MGDAAEGGDYGGLVQIASILTNNNTEAVQDITQLVTDYSAFCCSHQEWCDELLGGVTKRRDQMLMAFAYWLTGYDTSRKFGGYIDWKEATEDILWHLEQAIETLGYPLGVQHIPFTGEEHTDAALQMIDTHFRKQGYTLVSLDTGGDCYHLFVVPEGQFEVLTALGQAVDFGFFNRFQ